MGGLLIIGASQAGVQLAFSLRALGSQEPITLLGDEDHSPYQRPQLSKAFLQDKIDKESVKFRKPEYWEQNGINLVQNELIVHLDHRPDGSGIARAQSGEEFAYDRLALTVGARAARLNVLGALNDGVLYLRNADDALELKARAGKIRNVVIIGGGFIGLEAAASLRSMGKQVSVIELGERLVQRAVGPHTADFLLQHQRNIGVDVRLGSSVEEIRGMDGRVRAVRLDNGDEIPADIVLIGIGVIPNTGLAEQIGLEVNNGVVVDKFATASDGVTLAIGDCSNLPNPIPGAEPGERVRFESVNNAIEQAKVAAYKIMGREEEYANIPWFWSDQGDLKLQIAGLLTGYDDVVLRRYEDPNKFSVLYYKNDQIIAADAINAPLDFMMVRRVLDKGVNLPKDQVADSAVSLKDVIAMNEKE